MTQDFYAEKVAKAVERLSGKVVRTPVLNSPVIDEITGSRVFMKAEVLQKTGAFKYRGALNKLLSLEPSLRARGVVAFSSGNHGNAISAAAHRLAIKAVIVLPRNAPKIKVANCQWWGAEIIHYDPDTEDRETVGKQIAEERGMTIVPPFDDYDVIAGQATAGVELSQQLSSLGIVPDDFVVPCSGGGLASGSTIAMKHAYPDLNCIFVEPRGLEKMAPSIRLGVPQQRPDGPVTLLDGISGPIAGTRTMKILAFCGATGTSITDDEAMVAVATAYRHLKVVCELAGAAALAAVLANRKKFQGRTVALVLSGGNIDPDIFARSLQNV